MAFYNLTVLYLDGGTKMVEQLTDKTFSERISSGTIVVDFWASWCGPCMMMAPVFEELSSEYDDVHFAKLDTDAYGSIAAQQGISGIPCLIVYKDGKESGRIVGFMPKEQLKMEIDKKVR
jgi:thioredoxin 1